MLEFDIELPQDASGIDVAGIWKTVRQHIHSIKGWEVTEQVTLATLSFTKYLMWKDGRPHQPAQAQSGRGSI